MWQRLVAFIKLGRPLFLAGGFLNFGLGAAIARLAGHAIDGRRYVLGQAAVTAFQLMTDYANDYFDFEADRANTTPTRWSGGSRVLPDGQLPRVVARIAALVFAALGTAASALLLGATTTPVLIAIGVLAWEYSAPPLRLCASGFGELATAIVVTGLVPWLGFTLQAPDLVGAQLVLAAIVPLVLLQLAMMLAIEFPDAAGDSATGKRTLVVRIGARASTRLYIACTAAAYLWLPVAWWSGLPARVAWLAAIPAPVAVWRIVRAGEHADAAAFERTTTFAVGLLVATTAAMVASLVI